MKNKLFILAFIGILICSCDYIYSNAEEGSTSANIVASVGKTNLYRSDIINLTRPGMPSEDSTRITEQFVNNWIKKELLVQEAGNNVRINTSDIERKVADYRYALLSFEYQKLLVEQNLDTEISEEEIQSYYQENEENFALRQNIFRGKYLKINKEAPKKNSVKRWMKSARPQDLSSLKDYALQFADNYSVEDSAWIKLDDIIKGSPYSSISNKVQFLRNTRYVEEEDSVYLYLLKIDEYKISEEISPLEFVREDIRNIILHKRKVALTKGMENDIYERAKENEDYKVYR